MDNKKTFWPIGIVLFLSIMVCMIILTVYISIKSSPEDDNTYFSTRQIVDKEINHILLTQDQLEEEYKFYYIDNTGANHKLDRKVNKKTSIPIEIKTNEPFMLNIKITDNNGNNTDSAKVESIITRFATSKFDKNLGELSKNNDIFKSNEIMLEKGDWKVMIKVTIDDKNAFFEQYIKVIE
ncbi:hypothetical protein [Helicobacter sp. MIT 99-5507]|uniref:hypothetical protein n=1 Tax=Helicobacter sp. MIT 99-5507 TaxID=152489 RepID=UPI000E1E3BDF|nr:hypothetical protein [Helicobacter sp. MIT 99-5507]RDU58170.1 hypothetical protein CQA42_04540 [Helicobacter sp. MIT 99-5507]